MRSSISIMRFPLALVILPKLVELMSVVGFPHCGVLKMSVASGAQLELLDIHRCESA